ncbi:Cyanovirin-N [Rhypophila decipiens]
MHLSQVFAGLLALASPVLVAAAPVADNSDMVAFTNVPSNETEVATDASLAKRSFHTTCLASNCGISRDTGTLTCLCYRSDGFLNHSELPLSRCLINRNGNLQWQRNGGGMASCNTQTIGWTNWPRMDLECRNNAGNWVRTSVWLNERITNYNGVLDCLF